MIYDLIIVGGGPAGVASGVYAARKRLKTLLLTKEYGGQSAVSVDIQNWIGTPHISGNDLTKSFKMHLAEYQDNVLETKNGKAVASVTKKDDRFLVKMENGDSYTARAVLIASGADRRKLTVPGAAKYEHKGVVYCASCDAPLFSKMPVAVIGGGNAGFETAAQLLAHASSVTLLEYEGSFKADSITVEKVLAHPNIKALTNVETIEIYGEQMVQGLKYKNRETNEIFNLAVSGVFVEIGLIPNTSLVEGFLELDSMKRIVINPKNQRTSVEGVWAAGDCTNELYHQNNIAAGSGVKALEDIYMFLQTH